MTRAGVVVVAVIVTLGLMGLSVKMSRSPLSRRHLETFARRQALTITAGNGPLVVRCLAINRTWRRVGLWSGIACGFLWAARDGQISLNLTVAFLGWFVGAAVAEWRVAGLPRGDGRRLASLERRTVSSYLSSAAQALVALSVLVLAASFLAVVLTTKVADDSATIWALLWVAAAAVGLGLVGLTLRRVAIRRQPPAAPELLAADDALRASAAAVLAGSAIAAMGLPTAAMFELIGNQAPGDAGAWAGGGLAVMLVEFILGYLVATRTTPAPQRSQRSNRVATSL